MKKLFLLAIGLLCVTSLGSVHADIWDEVANIGYGVGDAVGNANEWVGDRSRESQEWQIEQEYNQRPVSERDLSYEEWKELKGYTTRGGAMLPQGDFSVTDYRQDFGSEIGENDSLRSYMKKVINFILSFLGIIATAMLVYAGYLYVTSGDGDGAEKAKKILIYVAIGIIIILASYAIVNTLIRNAGREGYDDRCGVIDNQPDCDAQTNCIWTEGVCETRDFERTDGMAYGMQGTVGVEGHYYRTNGGYIAPVGETLTFTVQSPEVESGNWDVGDGALHPITEPLSVPFYDVGMRVVRGSGVSQSGETFGVSEVILVGDPINPRFTMPSVAGFGSPVGVQDNSTTPPRGGSIVGYEWECISPDGTVGGGSCPDMSNFQKQFNMVFSNEEEGEYTIRLTVTSSLVDEAGSPATATTEDTIWVSADGGTTSSLAAQFSPNKSSLSLGEEVVADATYSRGAVEYQWECWKGYPGNDSAEDNACPSVSDSWSDNTFEAFSFEGLSGEETDQKYTGEYYISLTIRDADENESSTVHKKIIVLPAVPSDRPAARVRYKVTLLDQLNNLWKSLKAQSISNTSTGDSEDIYPSQTIEIRRGQKIEFETYMPKSSPYQSLPYTVTWWWNGNVIGSQPPEGIENYVKSHQLKVVVADKNDQNKKDTLLFNVKVKNNLPQVKVTKVETWEDDPAIPLAYARVSVEANDDADGAFGGIQAYKIEAREAGRYLTMDYVPTDKEEIETLINLSPYPGPRAFVFRATATDTDHESDFDQTSVMTIDVPYVDSPTVTFTASKTYAHTGEELSFYPNATGFPEGEEITYTWYWGDGDETETTDDAVDHTFEKSGNRQIRVVATSETAEAEAVKMMNIVSPFGTGEGNRPPTVEITGMAPGNTGDTSTIFTFCVDVNDPDGDELTYTWNLGDGNKMNVKNVGYQYENPGTYIVYLTVSDGQYSATDNQTIRVVSLGDEIPPSEVEYCEASGDSVLGDNVAIGAFANNLESFEDELSYREGLLREALADETDPEAQAEIQACIATSVETQAKIRELSEEQDPMAQQKLNDEITELLKKLHACDPTVDDRFVTVRGTPETTFFFYGYAPTSGDRPLIFKWETEDGQHFVGQDISTKFPNLGIVEVNMIVSDGVAEATASLNAKIEEVSDLEKSANLGAEVIDLSQPPQKTETEVAPQPQEPEPAMESSSPKEAPAMGV